MTTAKRKKTITIETRQRTLIRRESLCFSQSWCEFCVAEVEMATPELAAKILAVSVREIYRRVEKGELHFFESGNDPLLICVNSLKTK